MITKNWWDDKVFQTDPKVIANHLEEKGRQHTTSKHPCQSFSFAAGIPVVSEQNG